MQIKEAAQMTNLTKKAIEYYVSQGLIHPDIQENGYRDFSKEDINLLRLISLYRKLSFSLTDIKALLEKPKLLDGMLQKQKVKLEADTKRIKILEKINEGCQIESMECQINELNQKASIQKRLLDMFPGYFGKYICLHFGFFLNERIKDAKQEQMLEEIVSFLDNCADFEIPDDLKSAFDEWDHELKSEDIKKMNERIIENINDIEHFEITHRDAIKAYLDYRMSDDYRYSSINEIRRLLADFMQNEGYYDIFIPALRKLSPAYNEYYEKLMKADEILTQKYPKIQKLTDS